MKLFKSILVTGGAGFIGSHFVRRIISNYPNTKIVNLDLLTYAGDLNNLDDISNYPNYKFIHGDKIDKRENSSVNSSSNRSLLWPGDQKVLHDRTNENINEKYIHIYIWTYKNNIIT